MYEVVSPPVLREFTKLTFPEEEACFTLMQSSDEQLTYNLEKFSEGLLNSVEFIFVTRNNYTVPVKAEFAIMAVLNEMAFRDIL